MNPSVPARISARSRADRRLQSMTLGAAALGIAATGVFGYAAALTYTGTANAADQPAGIGGQVADPNVENTLPSTGGTSGGSGAGSSGGTVNPNVQTNPQNGVAPPVITRQRHHATTGGS